jgi:hypothetical protein
MKRIVCSLCGGTGVSYEIQTPVEVPKCKPVPVLEKQFQFDSPPTTEEEEAWKALEKNLLTSSRL